MAEAQSASPAPKEANPAPLGLAGFALTTFVLSLVNAGVIDATGEQTVLALALAYGGLAQFAAGMWEFKNGNTFGATAFSSYGAFWFSFAFFVWQFADAPTGNAVGIYLLAWGIFTFYMWIATLRHPWPVMVVFLLLWITFLLLALGEFAGGDTGDTIHKIGGYVGIVTAIAAWYASARTIINEAFGRELLPG